MVNSRQDSSVSQIIEEVLQSAPESLFVGLLIGALGAVFEFVASQLL